MGFSGGRIPRMVYIAAGILIMLCLGTVYAWSVFRLPVEALFDVGSTLSGLPYMTALATYAIFMMLTGRVLDRYKPIQLIAVGTVLVSGGWVLSGLVNNIYWLTMTYGVLSGAGVGVIYGVPMKVVAAWYPERKGLAVGAVLMGFGMSPLVTAPLARMLVTQYGVQNAFLMLGIAFGVVMPLAGIFLKWPETEVKTGAHVSTNQASTGLETSEMIRSKAFRGLYVNFLIGTLIGLTLIGKTATIGVGIVGLSNVAVASLLPIFAVFNGIGRPIFGWLADKLSGKQAMLMVYGLVILASVLMLVTYTGDVSQFVVAFSLFWMSLGGWLAIAPALTIKLFGTTHYSQNYGVVFTAYGIGAVVGVFVSGALLDYFNDYHMVFYLVIAACAIGIVNTLYGGKMR